MKSDAIIISKSELERMRGTTKIQTKEQESQQRKIMEEQREQQMVQAKQRKAKRVEMDKERQTKMPLTEQQAIEKEKNEPLLTKAQNMLDEEHDDVKHMNNMMLYSKVVTIRDQQKEEQKRLEEEWINEQKRLDIMMEIERLKSLKMQEEREVKRKDAQKQGALVIVLFKFSFNARLCVGGPNQGTRDGTNQGARVERKRNEPNVETN